MDKAMVKVARAERGAMAGRLLKLADEMGYEPAVVESVNGGYLVPVDLAKKLADGAQKGEQERETTKREEQPTKQDAPERRNEDDEPEAADVRAWAKANGVEVSEKGRVSRDVIEAYQKAQGR